MTRLTIGAIFLIMAIHADAHATSTLPEDSLDGVKEVDVSVVLGGALGSSGDSSLFAADPQLAGTLRPCIESFVRKTLARRTIAVAVRTSSDNFDANEPAHELVLGIYGRPIVIGADEREVMSYYVDLEFFVDLESLERTGGTKPPDIVRSSCEFESVYASSRLNTVLPQELRDAILKDLAGILGRFTFNPAYCTGEGKSAPECSENCGHRPSCFDLQTCKAEEGPE